MASSMEENLYLCRPKDRQRTFELWEGFHSTALEEDRLAGSYERVLFGEWARCRRLGVDPAMRQGVVLPPEEFAAILRDRSFLLGKAKPSLEKVSELLRGVPGIVIFTDEQGTILHIVGDPAVRSTAAEVSKIVEGSCWLESTAGTNGIGTAIARKAPVHVFSTEHFCEGWHRWTCAASPILDPLTQNIMGVVDFTTLDKDYREDAVALTHSLARSISAEIQLQVEMERMQLIHTFSVYSSRYPSDAIAVFDRLNGVVRSSAAPETEGAPGDWGETIEVCVGGSEDPIGKVMVRRREGLSPRRPKRAEALEGEVEAYGDFVTQDPAIKRMMGRIQKVLPTNLGILLIGETGTGKELVSRYIHDRSSRRTGPFVAVNCGMISRDLFESRFFGYERGAFTGADPRGKKGLFESAAGGTLFLDEIAEVSPALQVKFLRAIQEREVTPLGSTRPVRVDVRIIAATNRDLEAAVAAGAFRSDLFYRLNVVPVRLPALRERPTDIPLLVEHFVAEFSAVYGVEPKRVTAEAMDRLVAYTWPGNIRELQNAIERAFALSAGPEITLADLPPSVTQPRPAGVGAAPSAGVVSLDEAERQAIAAAMHHSGGNKNEAARLLGIDRQRLYRKLHKYGLAHS